MVKGVNKNVIEINDTGSEVFDRVVFYVSPKFNNISLKKLLSETDRITSVYERKTNKAYMSLRRRMKLKKGFCAAGAIAFSCIAVGFILYFIFS